MMIFFWFEIIIIAIIVHSTTSLIIAEDMASWPSSEVKRLSSSIALAISDKKLDDKRPHNVKEIQPPCNPGRKLFSKLKRV